MKKIIKNKEKLTIGEIYEKSRDIIMDTAKKVLGKRKAGIHMIIKKN